MYYILLFFLANFCIGQAMGPAEKSPNSQPIKKRFFIEKPVLTSDDTTQPEEQKDRDDTIIKVCEWATKEYPDDSWFITIWQWPKS